MKRILSVLFLLLTTAFALVAQNTGNQHNPNRPNGPGNMPSFEQFLADKTAFMVKEMQLNKNDSVKFVDLYMKLQQEKGTLMRKYRSDREVFRRLREGAELPDSLYLKIVFNDSQMQVEDAKLERDYLDKFSKILTPKQLFAYMLADRKFKNSFMQRRPNHNRNK